MIAHKLLSRAVLKLVFMAINFDLPSCCHLVHTSHIKSGTVPGTLVSTISRRDSKWRQRKNLQTLQLVKLPTYWTLFRELFLLRMRSSKKVCLVVTSHGQWERYLCHTQSVRWSVL